MQDHFLFSGLWSEKWKNGLLRRWLSFRCIFKQSISNGSKHITVSLKVYSIFQIQHMGNVQFRQLDWIKNILTMKPFFREKYIIFCNHRCNCKNSFLDKFNLEICHNILITSPLIHLTSEHLRFCSYVISCSVNQCWDYRWLWNVKARFNIVETW